MRLEFTKMQGCGNDYIYIDFTQGEVGDLSSIAARLSDRHFGIGGDGVIFICHSDVADAKMRMFNADGSEGKMCGNGIRCVAKFVHDKGISQNDPLHIETLSGIKEIKLSLDKNGEVERASVNMGAPIFAPSDIPARFSGERVIDEDLSVDGTLYKVCSLSMGNPHCVTFADDDFSLWDFDIESIGRKFECHPAFPDRVNTEFVKIISEGELCMRVWERGSGETLACGTGACAVAVAACLCGKAKIGEPIVIHLRGGDLTIVYDGKTVTMDGPAVTVFEGQIEIDI